MISREIVLERQLKFICRETLADEDISRFDTALAELKARVSKQALTKVWHEIVQALKLESPNDLLLFQKFIDAGIDVNQVIAGQKDDTMLDFLMRGKCFDLIARLIEQGATVNHPQQLIQALEHASRRHANPVIRAWHDKSKPRESALLPNNKALDALYVRWFPNEFFRLADQMRHGKVITPAEVESAFSDAKMTDDESGFLTPEGQKLPIKSKFNAQDGWRETALTSVIYASSSADDKGKQVACDVVKRLLEVGVDAEVDNNLSDETALVMAIHYGSEDLVNILVGAKVDVQHKGKWFGLLVEQVTPLSVALLYGRFSMAEKLITAGADVAGTFKEVMALLKTQLHHTNDAIFAICRTLPFLIKHGMKMPAMDEWFQESLRAHLLQIPGLYDAVKQSVEQQGLTEIEEYKTICSDLNLHLSNLFQTVAYIGDLPPAQLQKGLEAIDWLKRHNPEALDRAVNYSTICTKPNLRHRDHMTALFLAVEREHAVLVTALLEAGANPNVKCTTEQVTVMPTAVEQADDAIFKALVAHKMDLNASPTNRLGSPHLARVINVNIARTLVNQDSNRLNEEINEYISNGQFAIPKTTPFIFQVVMGELSVAQYLLSVAQKNGVDLYKGYEREIAGFLCYRPQVTEGFEQLLQPLKGKVDFTEILDKVIVKKGVYPALVQFLLDAGAQIRDRASFHGFLVGFNFSNPEDKKGLQAAFDKASANVAVPVPNVAPHRFFWNSFLKKKQPQPPESKKPSSPSRSLLGCMKGHGVE